MKLSIVIPVYNEEKTVTQILDYVLKVKLIADIEKELVIEDDCSKDRTPEMVRTY
ncbi:MAG: glycosyltransferase, partial [Bacteroidales bacterium]|nr:glycosyltransferase [Bacteroidales bacterium]